MNHTFTAPSLDILGDYVRACNFLPHNGFQADCRTLTLTIDLPDDIDVEAVAARCTLEREEKAANLETALAELRARPRIIPPPRRPVRELLKPPRIPFGLWQDDPGRWHSNRESVGDGYENNPWGEGGY